LFGPAWRCRAGESGLETVSKGGLLSFRAEVPDPRSRHGRQHPLSAVLALVWCAIPCGARGFTALAQWGHDPDSALMHRLGFTRRPPKMGGIRKVILALNRTAFEAALTRWAETLRGRSVATAMRPPEPFALDGQTARGRFDGLHTAVHLLALMAHESGRTLAQTTVPHGAEEKTTEPKMALRLVEGSVLEGRLITGDAMSCQRAVCPEIIDRKGHSLRCVKEDQPTLLQEIQAAVAPAGEGAFSPSAAATLA
jgi:hypothetical protein